MVDYYKEFNILKEASLDEIHEALAKLRNIWENRRMSGNESAEKKLVLLIDAEKIFKNDTNRKQYDRELDAAGAKPESIDPNIERKANFNKWFTEANDYLDTQEYDLAKSAINKAFQYRNPNDENALFFMQAAEIYRLNYDFRTALIYINEALVLEKDNPQSYLIKYLIFERLDDGYNSDRNNFNIERRRALLEIAIKNAKNKKDNPIIGAAYGFLARTWYFLGVRDIQKSAEYAREALKYASGDLNAKAVLEDIEKVQEQEEAWLNQQREAEEIRLQQQREAEEARLKREREAEEAKIEERRRQKRKADEQKRRDLLKKKIDFRNRIIHIISWVCFVGSAVYSIYRTLLTDRGVPYGGVGFLSVVAVGFLCYAVALDVGDKFERGFINPCSITSWVWGVFNSIAATGAARRPDNVFFNYVLFYIIVTVISVVLGYIGYKKTKNYNDESLS
jgi:hypothetical protein